MSAVDELLANTRRYAWSFTKGHLPAPPARQVAVVACMGCTAEPVWVTRGDARVIRNTGGVIINDVIRPFAISQRLLGIRAMILVHHTNYGILTFVDDAFKAQIEAETGIRPSWAAEAFQDVAQDVRQSLARITATPFTPHKDAVRGFVYAVDNGILTEVT